MRRLNLDNAFLDRVKAYRDASCAGEFAQKAAAKSDYWQEHSRAAAISFHDGYCLIHGQSGFYIPQETDLCPLRTRLKSAVMPFYRTLLLRLDRLLGMAMPHQPSCLVTYGMAYDFVVARESYVDYDPSPRRFDPLKLTPLFRDAKALKNSWFLKDRYIADDNIITAAYHHAMFSHFLEVKEGGHYLEIGAGNGNLCSFFRRYNRMNITIVDIPETILFSMCFLKSIFPEAKMSLPHEIAGSRLDAAALSRNDFTFLLPSQIGLLPDDFFDIATNTFSFQEMTPSQIEDYIQLVQRVCRAGALWGNHNRVEKVPSRNRPPIRAMSFPYVPGNEILVDEVSRFMRLVQLDDCVLRIERIKKGAKSPS